MYTKQAEIDTQDLTKRDWAKLHKVLNTKKYGIKIMFTADKGIVFEYDAQYRDELRDKIEQISKYIYWRSVRVEGNDIHDA